MEKNCRVLSSETSLLPFVLLPGRVAQSVGQLTRSGYILSFLLPLIQQGQLSVTGESKCTKYWLTA